MRRLWALAATLFALFAIPTGVRAQSCSVSVSSMNFGAADVLPGTAVDTTATITATCSGMPSGPKTCYCVGLGPGSGGTNGSLRQMTGSGGSLKYSLYFDSGRSLPWSSLSYPALGVAYGTCSTIAAPNFNITMYGRVATGQSTVTPGSYSSTLSGADVDFYTLVPSSPSCDTGTPVSSPKATTSFSVLASPPGYCTLSVANLAFGAQGVLSSNTDVNTSMTVKCSNTLPYTIALGNGGIGTGPTARKMTNGGSSITYAIYRDAARAQAWGSTPGVNMASGAGTGVTQTLTVYGRVPAQTTPAAGGYADTVVVTLSY